MTRFFLLTALAVLLADSVCTKAKVVEGAECIGPACKDQSCHTRCDCRDGTPYCLHDIRAATSQCVAGTARPPMPPLFFVHVPKTGGTTFRYAAMAALGSDSICTDYGQGLRPLGNWTVAHKLPGDKFLDPSKTRCRLLSGHVQAAKYVRDFGLRRTAMFLREPITRMVSTYHHHRRNYGLKGTFQQFLDRFRNTKLRATPGNVMCRIANDPEIPLAAFGFVGLTERYAESVRIFNDAFALDLQHGLLNVDPEPQNLPPELASDTLVRRFSADIRLFGQAQALFAERLRILDGCSAYAHGGVDAVSNGTVRGWAWWAHSDEEVEVAIVVGGALAGVARAGERHRLGKWGVPRDGDVGFEVQLPGQPQATEVCCFVKGTGQYLGPGLRHDMLVTNTLHPCHAGVALAEFLV